MDNNLKYLTSLSINIAISLKEEAQLLASDIGIPLSTIIIIQLKDFVRSRSLMVSALPRLDPKIEAEVNEAISNYKIGQKISPALSSSGDIVRYLRSFR